VIFSCAFRGKEKPERVLWRTRANTPIAMIDDPVLLNDCHVVGRSSNTGTGEVRATRLLGQDIVLWRSNEGLCAWQDLCLHSGARLSGGRVQDECLICLYHGWHYDASGQCVRIPAHPSQPPPTRARATAYAVTERYGLIWLCLGMLKKQEVPVFPEWDNVSFRKVDAGPYLFKAHGPRVIENFLDVGHFPFVHTGFLGDPATQRSATTTSKRHPMASLLGRFACGSRTLTVPGSPLK